MPEIPQISPEFIEETKQSQTTSKLRKRGGPYSKHDTEARKEEVYRLYFEYGYSARKIAQLMKVNRNTVNGDIDQWYSVMAKKWGRLDPEYSVIKQMEALEVQKSRIRQDLDKTTNSSEKIAFERLIFDIDSKIMQINLKLVDSKVNVHDLATFWLNRWMKKNGKDDRYMTWFDGIRLSTKSFERIKKIINEDKQNNLRRT